MSEENRPTVAIISGEDVARLFEPAGGLSGPVTVTPVVEEKDPNRIYLNEETAQPVFDEWKKRANEVKTPEEAAAFITDLNEKYGHDYGTIVHASAYAAKAGFAAVNNGPQGGITGFQAGFVMWMLVREFGTFGEGPLSMRDWSTMLYPQSSDKFDKIISKDTWEWLQKEAAKLLGKHQAEEADSHNTGRDYVSPHPDVLAHWASIVNGTIPFGYKLSEED